MQDVRHAARWAYAQYAVNGLLPLLLLPFLTRTLSTSSFAELAYFQAISIAIGLGVDFGLGQIHLGRLVRCAGDAAAEARLAAEVTAARALLLVPGALVLALATLAAPQSDATPLFAVFSLVHIACNGLSPFWVFQARMAFAAPIRFEIATRVAAFVAVLALVRAPDDGWKVHALLAAGVLANLVYLYATLPVKGFARDGLLDRAWGVIRAGSSIFAARTLLQTASQVPLLLLTWFSTPLAAAAYSVAERFVRALVSLSMPLTLAAAPVIARRLEQGSLGWAQLSSRLVLLGAGFAALAVGLYAGAEPIAEFLSQYPGQATLLRALSAWLPLAGLNAFLLHAILLPNADRFSPAWPLYGYGAAVALITALLLPAAGPLAGPGALVAADALLLVILLAKLRRALR